MKEDRARAIHDTLLTIRGMLFELTIVIESEGLQVGDRQFIERSLALLSRETESLTRHFETMLGDASRLS